MYKNANKFSQKPTLNPAFHEKTWPPMTIAIPVQKKKKNKGG